MKKVIALLSSILLIAGTQAYAGDASKIAVVNVQQVLSQSSKVADANTKLQEQFKSTQEKLTAQQKALQEELDKFNKDANNMAKKDRDALEKKINDDKADFLKAAGSYQKDVNQAQTKAMQTILGQLNKVISDLAKKDSYNLVLDSQAVVYSADATDITKDVASDFNK